LIGLFAITNFVLTPKVELAWLRVEPEAAQIARDNGRPLVVDFMAGLVPPLQGDGRPGVSRIRMLSTSSRHSHCFGWT
jgi:hypothetical protein